MQSFGYRIARKTLVSQIFNGRNNPELPHYHVQNHVQFFAGFNELMKSIERKFFIFLPDSVSEFEN